MNICITSQGVSLDSPVDLRFGRSVNFIFIDTETFKYESIENPYAQASGGAGIQAGQLTAVARWLTKERGVGPVTVVACGPRAGAAALTAAALETRAIAGVEVHGGLESLKSVIEKNWSVEQAQAWVWAPRWEATM